MERALFVQLADRNPNPIVVCRATPDELDVIWTSPSASGFELATLRDRLRDAAFAARWRTACNAALKLGTAIEAELPQSCEVVRHATVVSLDAEHVAVHFHPLTTEQQLSRETERRFEVLFSLNANAVFFSRLETPFEWPETIPEQDTILAHAFDTMRVSAVNDMMCHQLQTPREQIIGTAPRTRWEGSYPQWREHFRQLFDQRHTYISARQPRHDGTWLDVEGEYVCTYNEHGLITGYYGIQHDISMQREAAAKASATRERLELATIGADIVIWDIDVENQRVVYEPGSSWLARLGYEACEWPVEQWKAIIHPDDLRETITAFEEHLAGKTPHFRGEYRIRTSKGEWIWILCTGRVAADVGPRRVVGIAVDITERKALRARVVASERLASLGTLAAGVGHEINNPLTYVGLNLELLQRKLADLRLDPAVAKALAMHVDGALYGAKRVGAVVRDLQMLARPREPELAVVDPVAIVERCLRITEHQIRHRARLVTDLVPTPSVRSSEDRLVQVFLNLIVNAIHAIPEGAADHHTIRVATRAAGANVIVELGDTGVGIPQHILDHIFEPFFTTKEVGQGTGLGLSICRSIITELGGQIDVTSERGRGTTFTVTLPTANPVAEVAEQPRASMTNVRRVLVIDDEPALGQILQNLLSDIVVTCETTALGALARLRAGEAFDRILCDVMMPDVTGIDFYEQLDERLRPSIVFITGGTFTERARAFLERVPNRRLLKPFDMEQLEHALVGP